MEKLNSLSILFIEDEDLIRKNYISFLKRQYETVYEASNGEEAYLLYKEKKPDLLIIDINIPKMNGLELLKKIRQKDHFVKAIVLTAHSDVKNLLKATELKLTKYLIKPVTREELKDSLIVVENELINFEIKSKSIEILKNNYTWDYNLMLLSYKNNVIELTPFEKSVIEFLFICKSSTVSYEELILHIWGNYDVDKIDALKTIVKNIRKKTYKEFILNIYAVGYKINI